jgi:hypothetical protein
MVTSTKEVTTGTKDVNWTKETHWVEVAKDAATGTQLLKKNSSFAIHNTDTRRMVTWTYYMECLVHAGRISKEESEMIPFNWTNFKKFVNYQYRAAIQSYNVNFDFNNRFTQNDKAEARNATEWYNRSEGGFIPLADSPARQTQDDSDRIATEKLNSTQQAQQKADMLDGEKSPTAMLNSLKNMDLKQAKLIIKLGLNLVTEDQWNVATEIIAQHAESTKKRAKGKKVELSQNA